MPALFVFGLGYTASRFAAQLRPEGWLVAGTGRAGDIDFLDDARVASQVALATHIVSSVPPSAMDGGDSVLDRYGRLLRSDHVIAYLSSTGVYGDAGGAWVDESAPLRGRRSERVAADRAWLALGARCVRLPGIYGPGRSPLDRVLDGTAHRVASEQVFSRIHVDDIVAGVLATFDAPPGAYNLADDMPASASDVTSFSAGLLGLAPPPIVPLESLSPMARGFYAEHRRVATGKARRVLGWRPRYRDYREGLRALLPALSATSSPASATTPPATDSVVQR